MTDRDATDFKRETLESWYESYVLESFGVPRKESGRIPILSTGTGSTVTDIQGKEMLDFTSGQVCASTGHTHQALVRALEEQGRTLVHTNSRTTSPVHIRLAERLGKLLSPKLNKSLFLSTGSESNELALRIARKFTGSREIGGLMRGYAGITLGSLSVTGFGTMKEGYGKAHGETFFLPPPDFERFPFASTADCLEQCRNVIEYGTGRDIAGILVEPFMSSAGLIFPSDEYMSGLAEICHDYDALLVFDEAQTGLGRTGEWFGYQHFSVVPDMITLSKGLGGGIPLASTTVTDRIANELETEGFYHVTSHMNDPLPCRFALENIRTIDREGLVENAREMGSYFLERLESLTNRHETVCNPRGRGLLLGFDVSASDIDLGEEIASRLVSRCREKGLQVNTAGPGGSNTVRLLPPLNVSTAEIDRAVRILSNSLETIETRH